MNEQYMSDFEYNTHFEKLHGLRSSIVKDFPLKPSMRILDVATGEGFFAIELAKSNRSEIVGIDISQRAIRDARKNVKKYSVHGCIDFLKMDATRMSFRTGIFDVAVNFTGLEEIYMTSNSEGVQEMFVEVNRVLKPSSCFCFVVMPPEEMETEAQKLEVSLFDYVCGAKYLGLKEYEAMLRRAKFKLIGEKSYYSGVKFTARQARKEIHHVVSSVTESCGIEVMPFGNVWDKFGQEITKNGLGCYSKVVLIIAEKIEDLAEWKVAQSQF